MRRALASFAVWLLVVSSLLVASSAFAHGDLPDTPAANKPTSDDAGPDEEIEIAPGAAAPAGYHFDRRGHKAAIVGGALLFVPSYGLAVAGALGSGCDGCDGRQHRLFVPFAGPFLYALGCDGCGSKILWSADALFQIGGAALIVYGLVPRSVWVLDHTAEVTVAPTFYATNPGISVIGRF